MFCFLLAIFPFSFYCKLLLNHVWIMTHILKWACSIYQRLRGEEKVTFYITEQTELHADAWNMTFNCFNSSCICFFSSVTFRLSFKRWLYPGYYTDHRLSVSASDKNYAAPKARSSPQLVYNWLQQLYSYELWPHRWEQEEQMEQVGQTVKLWGSETDSNE